MALEEKILIVNGKNIIVYANMLIEKYINDNGLNHNINQTMFIQKMLLRKLILLALTKVLSYSFGIIVLNEDNMYGSQHSRNIGNMLDIYITETESFIWHIARSIRGLDNDTQTVYLDLYIHGSNLHIMVSTIESREKYEMS